MAGILSGMSTPETTKMKPVMMALALLCIAPMTALCQEATQTQFNVPPPPFVEQPDTASYQDTSATPAVPSGQAAPAVPGVAAIPGEVQAAVMPQGPGTAAEQGYDAELGQLQDRLRREAEDHAAMNTARQLGEVIAAPRVFNPVSSDLASRGWLYDWTTVLSGVGISPSKVHFEAARLTREDFAMWASRMVWAYGTPAQVRQMECCSP